MDLRHLRMPAAQSSTPPDRRPIAVGIIGRTAGRTVTIIRTADGVTGTVANGCPICRRVVGCTCLTPTTPARSYTDAARAAHDKHCDRCRTLTQDTNTRTATNGESMRRRDRLTLGLHRTRQTGGAR